MVLLATKEKQVSTYETSVKKAKVAVLVDYRGLTVAQLTKLRVELLKNNAQFTVVKNTLLKRVIKGSEVEFLSDWLKGPTGVVFGYEDEVSPLKALKAFLKEAKIGEVKGGVIGNEKLSAAQVQELADMPSLDELRGKLVGALNTPLVRLVQAIGHSNQSLVNVLEAYVKKIQ